MGDGGSTTSTSVVGGISLGGLELVDFGLAEKTGGDLALKQDVELSVCPASGLGQTEVDCDETPWSVARS